MKIIDFKHLKLKKWKYKIFKTYVGIGYMQILNLEQDLSKIMGWTGLGLILN